MLFKSKNKGKTIYIANLISVYGGTLVLSTLCANLRKLGYDAKLLIRDYSSYGNNNNLRNKIISNIKIAIKLFLSRYSILPKSLYQNRTTINIPGLSQYIDFKILPPINKTNAIIIYPEIIFGNPFGIKHVVRYLLFHHRYEIRSDSYSISDKFIAFRKIFNDYRLNPQENILTLNFFDKDLYKQYNFEERRGNCYLIYKGKNRKDLPKKFDGKVFVTVPDQEELVKVFNECKYCYSYDPQTFYNVIAAICGCIPIVVLEPGKTPEDYLTSEEKHYGVAYGDSAEQIEYAIQTRDKLLASLEYEVKNTKNTKNFIKYLETNFGPLRKLRK